MTVNSFETFSMLPTFESKCECVDVYIRDFALFVNTYCIHFLNNTMDKKSVSYKLAYHGFIKLIFKFNELDQLLKYVDSFNYSIVSRNSDLETKGIGSNGVCYYHSFFMYFYYQEFDPIKNLINKDIKNMLGIDLSEKIYKIQLLPYLWLSSIVFWREFGIGYYCLVCMFYNKFLNIFSWYGTFDNEIYSKKGLTYGNKEIRLKSESVYDEYLHIYTCQRFMAEYKKDDNPNLRGLYIYLPKPELKFIFNNALSIAISYGDCEILNQSNHAVVMEFYYRYNGDIFGGCIYDSNWGVEKFNCQFMEDSQPKENEKRWYLFIKETNVIQKNFGLRILNGIMVRNLFMNYFGFAFNSSRSAFNDMLFSILDCNLDNNIVTYPPKNYSGSKNLIVSIKQIFGRNFLDKMKLSLKEAFDHGARIRINNSSNPLISKFQIIHDISNFISDYQIIPEQLQSISNYQITSDYKIISPESIIERFDYFMNNNQLYLRKSYLIIEEITDTGTIEYLYMDNGMFFKCSDLPTYAAYSSYQPLKLHYYHLTNEFKFEECNFTYKDEDLEIVDVFRPNPYFFQPLINSQSFFKGGLTKINLDYKFIIVIVIFIIFIIILIIHLIIKRRKRLISNFNNIYDMNNEKGEIDKYF